MDFSNVTSDPHLTGELVDFKTKSSIGVQLFKDKILITDRKRSKSNSVRTLLTNDISGCLLSKLKNEEIRAYLTIYTYEIKKNEKRRREELVLEFANFGTHRENFEMAQKWKKEIKQMLQLSEKSEERPYIVFVNPKSGAGKAKNIFYERTLTVFGEANVPHVLVLTKYANHAREYVRDINVSDYCGIVVISGDGLLYEIINGLADRPDFSEAIKIPITQIPGGSANAMACSLSYITNETFRSLNIEDFATSMSFNLVKSKPVPLDIVSIQLCDDTFVQSFLSVQWAIIADVDLESENYRYLGEFRFTIGAIKRILDLRIYRGRVSFLPADSKYVPKDPSIKITQNNNEIKETTQMTSSNISFKHLRPFSEPVPNDWFIIEENFVLFLIMNLPILTYDFTAAPDALNNDGCMHMMFMKAGVTRFDLLRLFSDTQTGNHLSSPLVEYVKIKAFRLEPLSLEADGKLSGNFMIDGEKIPYGNIQGEIRPSLGNVFAFNKD